MSVFPFASRRSLGAVVLLAGLSLASWVSQADATSTSGNLALTSDYVWRGTTQTQGDPAVQASFKVAAASGWYGLVWGSSVEFAPETRASSEFDLVVGWTGQVSDAWALDLNLTHYRYPATTVDLDWTEFVATTTWKQNYWLQLGYSPEALATDEAGTYAQLGAKFPIGDTFRLEASAGHYWLEDAYGDDYAHAQLSGIWGFKAPFELRASLHGTDSAAKRLFPDLAGSRVEVALQASF